MKKIGYRWLGDTLISVKWFSKFFNKFQSRFLLLCCWYCPHIRRSIFLSQNRNQNDQSIFFNFPCPILNMKWRNNLIAKCVLFAAFCEFSIHFQHTRKKFRKVNFEVFILISQCISHTNHNIICVFFIEKPFSFSSTKNPKVFHFEPRNYFNAFSIENIHLLTNRSFSPARRKKKWFRSHLRCMLVSPSSWMSIWISIWTFNFSLFTVRLKFDYNKHRFRCIFDISNLPTMVSHLE